jgi:hypothetical protein
MWTVNLTADDIHDFPLAAHHAYMRATWPGVYEDDDSLPELDEELASHTIRVLQVGTTGDYTLYALGEPDDEYSYGTGITWDRKHGVFWYCGGIDCSSPWSDQELADYVAQNADELLDPTWWAALVAGWLHRTHCAPKPTDLLSALNQLLHS